MLTENWKPKSTDKTTEAAQNVLAPPPPPSSWIAEINGKEYKVDETGKLTPELDYQQVNTITIKYQKPLKLEWILKCTNVTSLYLDDCDLIEAPDLSNLKNLQSLYLIGCNLQAPPKLEGLSKLVTLSLQFNPKLTQLPANLNSCEQLHILYVDKKLEKEAKKLNGPAEGQLYIYARYENGSVNASQVPPKPIAH